MEFKCYDLLHGGEGPRGDSTTVCTSPNRSDAAEEAANYFDDLEQHKERCGHDPFDGAVRYIEVVGPDGKSTKHSVFCEVLRKYMDVL
jgi:hypothetical protein